MTVISSTLQDESYGLADGNSTYSAQYEVVCDTRGQSARSAITQAQSALPDPIPAYYATFSLLGTTDVNAFCQSIQAKRKDKANASRFLVDVQWSPIDGDPDNDQTSEDNPLLKATEYWGEFENIQMPVEEARNVEALAGISRAADTLGPIQNAAGQEPSSPLMKTVRVPVLVAERNFTNLVSLLGIGYDYADAINDATFFGAAIGTAIYRGMSISRPKFGGGVVYWSAQQRVAVFEKGWDYKMVNRGWKFLYDDGGTTKLREATMEDEDGNEVPVSEPINLELDGTPTPAGDIGTFINWQTSEKKDFSSLGIGTS